MNKRRVSLRKSVFVRLLVITIAAVLMFYGIGVAINSMGIRNVRTQLINQANADAIYMASELNRDIETLRFFCRELCNDKSLMKYVLLNDSLSAYQRMVLVNDLFRKGYEVRRFSPIAEDLKIMLPLLSKCITAGEDSIETLDITEWNDLCTRFERGATSVVERNGSLWLTMLRIERNQPLVMIALEISKTRLLTRLNDISGGRTDAILLMRDDGTTLLGTDEGLHIFGLDNEGVEDANAIRAEARVENLGMTLVSYRQIDRQMRPFVNYRVSLWLLTLIALGLLAAYLTYYRHCILRPVDEMLDTIIAATATGQLRMNPHTTSDFDDIYAEFNHMIEHIEELTSQVYEEQIRAQQAELKQLQLQIDPHFLFNSLYLVYRMAQSDGHAAIANLSLNLSKYYRYITKKPQQIVSLKEEIDHVMNYMEIQRIRFSPRITIDVQPLPDEMADEQIPSLIIQPIVENAFLHGVKDITSGGVVSLRYVYTDREIQVIVSDNSGRMGPKEVQALWERICAPDAPESNALRNLYRRMQLYYGNDHGLELRSVNNSLTAILTFERGRRSF